MEDTGHSTCTGKLVNNLLLLQGLGFVTELLDMAALLLLTLLLVTFFHQL